MIKEGDYRAKVVGCFLGESKEKKTPFFGIEFQIEGGEKIEWIAYLSSTRFVKNNMPTTMAIENIGTLRQIGYFSNKLADLADNTKKISDLFTEVDNIKINIAHENFDKTDNTVGTKAIVKYVKVGGAEKLDYASAIQKFKQYNFDGILVASKHKVAVNPTSQSQKTNANDMYTTDEIPF